MSPTLYLYGFVPADAPAPSPAELPGIDERPVRLVSMEGFQGVVSEVEPGEYDEEAVTEGLRDMEWVGRRGLAHERVVTWFVDRSSIVPVRFLTLFSGEEALREHVEGRTPAIRRQLERFAGVAEWDLKVAVDGTSLEEHLGELSSEVAALEKEIEDASPGRRYLLTRKRDELVERESSRVAEELARDLLHTLRDGAVTVREIPVPDSGDGGSVVLNAAFLVAREAEETFREALEEGRERLEGLGLTASFSGPWAPYRFVEAEETEPGRSGPADAEDEVVEDEVEEVETDGRP